MLRLARPVGQLARVPEVQALHFLQESDVRVEVAQAIAQFVNHHAAIELGETLVDVVGADA